MRRDALWERPRPFHGPTCLYRSFDEIGDLLYVGISNAPKQRWKQHAADKPWWPLVAARTERWFETEVTPRRPNAWHGVPNNRASTPPTPRAATSRPGSSPPRR
ncbi:GIY-YIG nuclease family protein [Streptomyces sp. NPDC048604]|uniref:GIY-YIG nuclease family protein n=1 Tax=Streptomyces sp. NPDC048604 TaxID=3365578 RepID=UPI00371C5CF8